MNLKSILICPYSKKKLNKIRDHFVSVDKSNKYKINKKGIPLFYKENISQDAQIQKEHYDKIANIYEENLEYPHTKEYMTYLDKQFLNLFENHKINILAELCCGTGEAVKMLKKHYDYAVGIDVSEKMLSFAYDKKNKKNIQFIQADALRTPFKDNTLDTVVVLGGIHHLNDRQKFFTEISRILKPKGSFFWREPVDDFFLWRYIRKIIYRISPVLDHKTESPLRYKETIRQLKKCDLEVNNWNTIGFFGFCFFMNSDVLWFNRFFRFLPFIKQITRYSTKIDHFITSLKFMKNNGLIVVGSAKKMPNI
tara:strand:+ start:201 stop:1127 length:927 start_codon:yes stop_codon:yes gene_type:complete